VGGAVIAVIFEVEPDPARMHEYLDAAALLRGQLEAVDGFLSVERFESLSQPGKLLSLSFWRDEEAVRAWRNSGLHRQMQSAGRGGLFRHYRLRVAQVVRDYGLNERAEAPADARAWHGGAGG
jgi:heme-degrading monooxygenase HmoA